MGISLIVAVSSTTDQNSLANQVDTTSMPQRVLTAIKTAANQTGVDFSYLLKKATQESSLDPNAKASSSSATGLYQFTQQTWLQMVKNYGGKYNLGTYADHISMDSNGVAHVNDPTWKKAILNLRKDPTASAEMAGELDKENLASLQDNVGGKIGGTELYLAHFLGAGGASKFLNEMQDDPKQTAADVLPSAAAANPSVFYAKDGTPKTLQQIYHHFAQKFDGTTTGTMVASAAPIYKGASTMASSTTPTPNNANLITVADASTTAGVTAAFSPFTAAQLPSSTSSATSSLNSQGSSLFATMILAQMKDDTASHAPDFNHNKKNPYDVASTTAVG